MSLATVTTPIPLVAEFTRNQTAIAPPELWRVRLRRVLSGFTSASFVRCRRIVVLTALAAWVCTSEFAYADKPVPAADLAVDQVSIKGGPKLLGAALGREADGALAFAVRREWLKPAYPQLFEKAVREEMTETRAAFIELRDRIAAWRKNRAPEGELDFFLKKELERIDKELKGLDAGTRVEDAPFLVIDVAPAKIERVVNQTAQHRAVAQAAWSQHLPNVETRSLASLAQEVKKLKIVPVDDPELLLDFLPPRRENDSAWSARQALVEYQLRKPLDFQGTGDLVFQVGDNVQAGQGAKLIEELIRSLAGGALQDLLDPRAGKPAQGTGPAEEKWLAAAIQKAKAADVAGCRVTHVDQNLEARSVSVETRFVARLPDGSWKTVWQHVEKADAAKPRAETEQQIMQDPQVRAALDLVKAVGLGAEDQVKLAVRFGAAIMEAQKAADSRFFQFRDRNLRRLDGPVLRVAPIVPAKGAKK